MTDDAPRTILPLPSYPGSSPADRGGTLTKVSTRRLVFEVSGTFFAVDVGHVREALDLPPATPLPGTPDWVLGLVSVRGTLFAVVDFGRFLRLAPATESDDPTCLVFEHGGRRLGALVSQLVGVEDLDETAPEVPGEMLEALRARPFVVSVTGWGERPLWHLDIERVFSDVYP